MHKCLEEVIAFCLDLCEQDNCAGDCNAGISPCIMWKDGDINNDGNLTKADCLLKNIKRLKKEVASID